jgi:O-acetylhomoserine (thiol)-lyase
MKDSTLALHYGYDKDKQKAMQVPIYMTTAYEYDSTEHAARLFNLEIEGNIYTRIDNPTTKVFEKRIAALERGIDALATASGMAAIFYSLANLVKSGDNIIISNKLYGGSITLSTHTLKKLGIKAKFFDVHNPEELEDLIDDKTKAILIESVSNPALAVPDFEGISEVAKKRGVILICDNTIATPYGVKPLQLGCDIVVHSASKYIVGNGSAIGGVIIEGKSAKEKLSTYRYPDFNEPDESYHGLIYNEKFDTPFIAKARLALLRDFGAVISPFNAWLMILGLEHLHLRIKAHSDSALEIAKFLKSYPSNQLNTETSEKLIKYLINNAHWSPLEMVSACLEIETTRDIARQMLRHRSFSFQEFSQRYANPVKDLEFIVREARMQDPKNRQNSIETENDEISENWKNKQEKIIKDATEAYNWAIENGIAKEQARSVLPEGNTVSRLYMNGTLRSWIHYIELRSANGTQKEHMEIAIACADVINKIFPMGENLN